jgi:amphi-Trp domain-containing protein
VSLDSGTRTLHLAPPGDLKLELKVKDRKDRGKIEIEIA